MAASCRISLSSVRSEIACADARSPSPNPSAALPGPTSDHHTPGASGSTSLRSRRSSGSHRARSGLATSKRQPGAASQQSLQAWIFLGIAVLLRQKAILRVGPLQWGWIRLSPLVPARPTSRREVLGRTAMWNPSTASCAMSCSMVRFGPISGGTLECD